MDADTSISQCRLVMKFYHKLTDKINVKLGKKNKIKGKKTLDKYCFLEYNLRYTNIPLWYNHINNGWRKYCDFNQYYNK